MAPHTAALKLPGACPISTVLYGGACEDQLGVSGEAAAAVERWSMEAAAGAEAGEPWPLSLSLHTSNGATSS